MGQYIELTRMKMKAMQLVALRQPLVCNELEVPMPSAGQVLVKVSACAVCRTDLHLIDGDLPNPKLPLVPGHEIAGIVAECGAGVDWTIGERVGIPWLGWTCGLCRYCRAGKENLCDSAKFTGYTVDGGYAEYVLADARFCLRLPPQFSDVHAAPLLCAGLIGYRSLVKAGDAVDIGIYGFGAAAHLVTQVARHQGRRIYAFTRSGDATAQDFARKLGAVWAGGSEDRPPAELDAAIIFAPVGALVPLALKSLRKGGVVVSGGIHMSDIPTFPYADLWQERSICSVANLTRRDGAEFLKLAAEVGIRSAIRSYPLEAANEALADLREGRMTGAAVLTQ